ncbi:MAG: hypothetical protein Q9227_004696 [Pyrenula ochraceoflavens]
MEAAGLAIGAIGLASLFSLCVQCFDYIENGRNLSPEYELMIVKLSIEKRRLMIWGEAVGILTPDEDRDPVLDEPDTHKLVEQILLNVSKLFQDAEALKGKYGLEESQCATSDGVFMIEGSSVCTTNFEASAFTQFQRRLSTHRKKKGILSKSRWAIRDSAKFVKLIGNLKDLIDGLGAITLSKRSELRKGTYVREETEAIPDLRTLEIIEETCADIDWRTSASVASSYLRRVAQPRRADHRAIDEWLDKAQIPEGPKSETHLDQIDTNSEILEDRASLEMSFEPSFANSQPRIQQSPTIEQAERPSKSPTVERMKYPLCGPRTQVFVMCSSTSLVAWLGSSYRKNITRLPAHCKEGTSANRITYNQIMKAVKLGSGKHNHTIAVYCPPRTRYLHMAACFAHMKLPSNAPPYTCRIRIDDRLLDPSISFPDIADRMQRYHENVEDALQDLSLGDTDFANAIDLSWLERRLDVLFSPDYEPLSETLDWNTIFRASRDDDECAAIIILAGETACEAMLNAEPVLPPDYFRGERRVYRLNELDNRHRPDSRHVWKAEHYCNIAVDKEFDELEQFRESLSSEQQGLYATSGNAPLRRKSTRWRSPSPIPIPITHSKAPTNSNEAGTSGSVETVRDTKSPSYLHDKVYAPPSVPSQNYADPIDEDGLSRSEKLRPDLGQEHHEGYARFMRREELASFT